MEKDETIAGLETSLADALLELEEAQERDKSSKA